MTANVEIKQFSMRPITSFIAEASESEWRHEEAGSLDVGIEGQFKTEVWALMDSLGLPDLLDLEVGCDDIGDSARNAVIEVRDILVMCAHSQIGGDSKGRERDFLRMFDYILTLVAAMERYKYFRVNDLLTIRKAVWDLGPLAGNALKKNLRLTTKVLEGDLPSLTRLSLKMPCQFLHAVRITIQNFKETIGAQPKGGRTRHESRRDAMWLLVGVAETYLTKTSPELYAGKNIPTAAVIEFVERSIHLLERIVLTLNAGEVLSASAQLCDAPPVSRRSVEDEVRKIFKLRANALPIKIADMRIFTNKLRRLSAL